MTINYIPSYASEYEYVILFRDPDDSEPDTWDFYTIAESQKFADMAVAECKDSGLEVIVIHNLRTNLN